MPYKDPDKQREYHKNYGARRRKAWLEHKSCTKCGSTEQLEIDHINPETKLDHKVWTWAAARRNAELAKCQVLCHKHHVQKSLTERPPGKTFRGVFEMLDRNRTKPWLCRISVDGDIKHLGYFSTAEEAAKAYDAAAKLYLGECAVLNFKE